MLRNTGGLISVTSSFLFSCIYIDTTTAAYMNHMCTMYKFVEVKYVIAVTVFANLVVKYQIRLKLASFKGIARNLTYILVFTASCECNRTS